MKNKEINLIIESIIEEVINEIENDFLLIKSDFNQYKSYNTLISEDFSFEEFQKAGQAFWDIYQNTGVVTEDEAALIGALSLGTITSIFTTVTGLNMTVPGRVLESILLSIFYFKASRISLRLKNSTSGGQRTYFGFMSIIYGFLSLATLAGGIASVTANKLINTAQIANQTALKIARPYFGRALSMSEAKKIATRITNDLGSGLRSKGATIEIKILGETGDDKRFAINNSITFTKDANENVYVLVPKKNNQEITAVEGIYTIDLDVYKNENIFKDTTRSVQIPNTTSRESINITTFDVGESNLQKIPANKARYKTASIQDESEIALLTSEINSTMDTIDRRFDYDITSREIENAEQATLENLRASNQQIRKIETRLEGLGSVLSKEEAKKIRNNLDIAEAESGLDGFRFNITDKEKDVFENFISSDSTLTPDQKQLIAQTKSKNKNAEIARVKQENPSTETPQPEGGAVTGGGAKRGIWSTARDMTTDAINKRGKSIRKIETSCKTSQTKLNLSLQNKPIEIPHKITYGTGEDQVLEASIVIFAYRSPGIYIGALRFNGTINAIDNKIATLAAKKEAIKRELKTMAGGDALIPNEDGSFSMPASYNLVDNEGNAKGAQTKGTNVPKIAEDTVEKNNEHTRLAQEINELNRVREQVGSLSKNPEDPGTAPMAFDYESNVKLKEHLEANLETDELADMKELRKRMKIESMRGGSKAKETLWYKAWNASSWNYPLNTVDYSGRNTFKTGIVLNGVGILFGMTGLLGAYQLTARDSEGTTPYNAAPASQGGTSPSTIIKFIPDGVDNIDLGDEIDLFEKEKAAEAATSETSR